MGGLAWGTGVRSLYFRPLGGAAAGARDQEAGLTKAKKVAKKKATPAKARRSPSSAGSATRSPAKASKRRDAAPVERRPPPAERRPAPVERRPAPIALAPVRAPAKAPSKVRRKYGQWRELLIGLRHRLLREGSHLEEEGLKALEQEVSVDHMADYGSDSYEQETTLQLIETNSLSLRDVDNALKRIEQGTYGLCEDCEALIPHARLAVLPHARYCIACQSKREGVAP